MLYLGVLIMIGAAVALLLLGVLPVLGGVRTTQQEMAASFKVEQLGGGGRAWSLLLIWVPIAILGIFGILTLVQMVSRAIEAL